MSGIKTWELHNVRVEEYASGPRAGERKPIKLPADAVPVSITAGMQLQLYYLVPKTNR